MTKGPRIDLAHILGRARRIEVYVRDGHDAFLADQWLYHGGPVLIRTRTVASRRSATTMNGG